jgi:Tfp pilus assembly protein PilN
MSTATTQRVATATLPVVNLLPPEIAEQRRLRKLQYGLGLGVVAAAGVVGALFLAASNDASAAQDELANTQAQGVRLQAETAKYSNVPAVIAKVDAAKLQRSQAMAQEIRWSFYLNDLSLQVPSRVWLTKITATENADAAATAAAAATTYPETGIGQVTFDGQAYDHNNVASWLQMLARQKGYSQAYFTKSEEDQELTGPDGKPAVNFTSQVTLTDDALSRRFDEKAGS